MGNAATRATEEKHNLTLRDWRNRLEKGCYAAFPALARRLPLPDFLGIGAQKAGTTWLHSVLREHPDVAVPSEKEVHYFDLSFDKPLREYSQFFAANRGKVCGDITPAYSILSEERIRFIRRIMPDTRLIFLMRNPVERAWSHAVMFLTTRQGRTYDEVTSAEFLEFLDSPPSTERSDYEGIIDRWTREFPKEQLFVGFFEDIRARPKELLIEIFQHLGIRSDIDWDTLPVEKVVRPAAPVAGEAFSQEVTAADQRKSQEMPPEIRQHLEARYSDAIQSLAERFGSHANQWVLEESSR